MRSDNEVKTENSPKSSVGQPDDDGEVLNLEIPKKSEESNFGTKTVKYSSDLMSEAVETKNMIDKVTSEARKEDQDT